MDGADADAGQWTMPAKDFASTRYSALAQINLGITLANTADQMEESLKPPAEVDEVRKESITHLQLAGEIEEGAFAEADELLVIDRQLPRQVDARAQFGT